MPEYRSNWNEATRVQMPALVHLTRIGYEYFGKITEDIKVRDWLLPMLMNGQATIAD